MDNLETERLILRPRTRESLTHILKQPQDVQFKFFGYETLAGLERRLDRISKALDKTPDNWRMFDLVDKKTSIVVGSCGFHNWAEEHYRAELGYELHESFRGKGYMAEAAQRILAYGFTEMNLNRIEAMISPKSQPSLNVVKRFGFTGEGLLRGHYHIDDRFEDSAVFSLLRSEFPLEG